MSTAPDPVASILPRIRAMHGYVPGSQTEDPEIIKLNTNENPFPVPDKVRAALTAEIDADVLQKYPNPTAAPLRATVGRLIGGDVGDDPGRRVLIGNGSDEVLSILFRATLDPDDGLVFARPTYSLYPVLADILGAKCMEVDVREDWRMDLPEMARTAADNAKLLIIANPNAPTGLVEDKADLLRIARENPGLTLVDEAYVAFGGESVAAEAGTDEYPRLLACGTFSKAYSLAGQRIGWMIAHPTLIHEFDKIRDSYNLSRLAQVAGLAALEDIAELNRRTGIIVENRTALMSELRALGFECLESKANFVFVRPPERFAKGGASAARGYFEHLQRHKIMVRYFPTGRIADWVRITIGTAEQNAKLIQATRAST
jgi:histidinol-phosphate aminotransferase